MIAAGLAPALVGASPHSARALPHRPLHGITHRPLFVPRLAPLGGLARTRPWVEGVTPPLENRLFDETYKILPSHNVLKVYVFNAGGYQSAGIRFSARVPHTGIDLNEAELDREARSLISTTFDRFPELKTVDIWATVPVPNSEATSVESTVFSVSADRATYEAMRSDLDRDDAEFLAAFGHVWISPEVPR